MPTQQSLDNDIGDHFREQARQLGTPIQSCQHCYCGKIIVNGQEHMVCCMCGHRTLINPISF